MDSKVAGLEEQLFSRIHCKDKTKIKLFRDVGYVWRKKGKAFKQKNIVININTVTRDITYFKIHCSSGKIRQVKLQQIQKA